MFMAPFFAMQQGTHAAPCLRDSELHAGLHCRNLKCSFNLPSEKPKPGEAFHFGLLMAGFKKESFNFNSSCWSCSSFFHQWTPLFVLWSSTLLPTDSFTKQQQSPQSASCSCFVPSLSQKCPGCRHSSPQKWGTHPFALLPAAALTQFNTGLGQPRWQFSSCIREEKMMVETGKF